MDKIRIFSLRRHSHLFAVPDNSADYLFLQAENHPYLEEPYRAESYGLAYVKEGSIHLQAGLSKYLIEAPAMITLAPSMIRSFSKSSEVMKMDILFFKDSFLSEGNRNLFFLMEYDFFEKAELCVVPLSGDLLFKVATIFQLLGQNQSSSALHYTAICRNYLLVLIYELDAYHRNRHQHDQEAEQIHPIVARFRKLLTSSYMLERKLDFYAETATHVNQDQIHAARARFVQQQLDIKRYQTLLRKEAATGADMEQVRARHDVASSEYSAAKNGLIASISKIDELKTRTKILQADLKRKEAGLTIARLNLSYIVVLAPYTGRMSRKNIQEGQQIQVGQALVNIVNESSKWVTANFKETQVEEMYVGQPVKITVDASDGKVYRGKIIAIAAAMGAKASLLPPDNSTGNFVKIIQRVPVRLILMTLIPIR